MLNKSIIVCTVLAAGLLAAQPAIAADAPPTGAVPAPLARVLVVDLGQIMLTSKAGQDMQKQVKALSDKARADLGAEKAALEREQSQIAEQSAILAPDVKQRRIRDFELKARAFQQKAQQREEMIQGGLQKAQQQILEAVAPILQGIMRERRATVLMHRNAVLVVAPGIDITPIAVQRLDMKVTSIKVELAPPSAKAKQAAQAQQDQEQ